MVLNNSDLTRMDFLVASRLYGKSTKKLYSRLHRDLEKFPRTFTNHEQLPEILEVGAGSGEHLNFVKYPFKRYVMTDISELGLKNISNLLEKNKISFELANVEALPFNDCAFDRIIATCVLAHVENPYKAFQELRRVLRVNGTASILLSADPSILLRVIRHLFVKQKMRDLPMNYLLYNALAHRNSCSNLITIAKSIFECDSLVFRYSPLRLPFWNLSTHIVMHVRKNS